ncbi:MAG: sulfatase-like hydrolase/transferase [Opitutaceae bacterium]|nr:sulfatase-like hydrolase/transferase [Opitutaceae bacterium]
MSRLLLTVLLLSPFLGLSAAAPARPNLLVIVADDLGYGDLGVQGGRDVPTPHLDALAAAGTRFTSGYVSAPYCSPARAGFLTGRYQTRFGHEFNPHVGEEATLGLPLGERTLADHLRAAGYATGLIGKWHLGFSPRHHPQSRGFDEFLGFLVGAHNFTLRRDAAPKFGTSGSQNLIYRGREVQRLDGFATTVFTDEAIAFADRHAATPWFLYLAYNAVHTPLEIDPTVAARVPASVTDPARRGYLALLLGLDDSVGRLRAHLDKTGRARDTLIVFFSDNGGSGRKPYYAYNTGVNRPLRGDKGQVLEGGIRVPFFAAWPGRIPAGRTSDHPVIALDVLPTALAAAGAPIPAGLDGANLLPLLTAGSAAAPHAALFWRFGPQRAVRRGQWKLTDWRDFDAKTQSGWQLYDVAADPGESLDLAAQNPGLVRELAAAWETWNLANVAPVWRGTPNEDPDGHPPGAVRPSPKKK